MVVGGCSQSTDTWSVWYGIVHEEDDPNDFGPWQVLKKTRGCKCEDRCTLIHSVSLTNIALTMKLYVFSIYLTQPVSNFLFISRPVTLSTPMFQ